MLRPWFIQLNIEKKSDKPIYIQIADEIIQLIKNGVLKPGEMLPGTRRLAEALKVNRNTVVQALDILLVEGWLASVERKGTFVPEQIPVTAKIRKVETTPDKKTNEYRKDRIFFDDGLPDTQCAPMNELARAYRRIFNRKARWQVMNLSNELGDIKFREAISTMLNHNRRMQTNPHQLCITRGSQMALYLTAQTLLEKEDIVLVEHPGFRPAWETFIHAGARLIPVEVDHYGVNVDKIEKILKHKKIKAIYLTPHHQYPTTVTLSLERRLRLIELSDRYNFTIIEDDYDNEFHFAQRPVMPISAFEGITNYIYIGTFSKLIAPAIRIGYIFTSHEFISKVGKLRKIIDGQGDNIMEQSILELINAGDIRKHHKRMLSYYMEKRDYFSGLLDHYLEDKITYRKPDGGLAFWISPTRPVNLYLLQAELDKDFAGFYTPDRFSLDNSICGIRLGYASLSRENLEKGIRLMATYL